MGRKFAIVAVVLVAGLAAILFARSRQPRGWDDRGWTFPKVESPTAIEITRQGETFVLEGSGESWRMTAPAQWAVDTAKVRTLVDLVTRDVVVDLSRPVSDGAALGFDGPTARPVRVLVRSGSTTAVDVTLGASVEVSGASARTLTWVRPAGVDGFYRVNKDFRASFDVAPADLRDRAVLAFAPSDVTAVRFAVGDRVVDVRREATDGDAEKTWRLRQPGGLDVDPRHVDNLLTSVSRMRALGFADTVTPEAAGIGSASPRMTIVTSAGETTVILGGAVPTGADGDRRHWVQVEGNPTLYEVSTPVARRIATSVGDLVPRDILSLDEATLTRIVVGGEDGFTLTRKPDAPTDPEVSAWTVTSPRTIEAPKKPAVDALIRQVAELKAERVFHDIDYATTGMEPPTRAFTVHQADGTVLTIRVGGPVPNEDGVTAAGGETARYVQVNNGPVFEMSRFRVANLLKPLSDLE